jgi:hypothetical protein
MQKIGLQIEFGAVRAPLSGHYACSCGARVPPPIPSGFARNGNHCIDENELADRYPLADDSSSERSKRLSNESGVCPLSDFPDHNLSVVISWPSLFSAEHQSDDVAERVNRT